MRNYRKHIPPIPDVVDQALIVFSELCIDDCVAAISDIQYSELDYFETLRQRRAYHGACSFYLHDICGYSFNEIACSFGLNSHPNTEKLARDFRNNSFNSEVESIELEELKEKFHLRKNYWRSHPIHLSDNLVERPLAPESIQILMCYGTAAPVKTYELLLKYDNGLHYHTRHLSRLRSSLAFWLQDLNPKSGKYSITEIAKSLNLDEKSTKNLIKNYLRINKKAFSENGNTVALSKLEVPGVNIGPPKF